MKWYWSMNRLCSKHKIINKFGYLQKGVKYYVWCTSPNVSYRIYPCRVLNNCHHIWQNINHVPLLEFCFLQNMGDSGGSNQYSDGSPIGLYMSLELASLYMSLWDKQIREKLRKLYIKVDVYTHYVDAILIRAINPGWGYCEMRNTMIFDRDKINPELNADQHTFGILLKIP